jgi:hypothetical protein
MTTEQEKELLLSFTVLNKEYQNPAFRFVRGLDDADSGNPEANPPVPPDVGTIDNPRDTGVPMRTTVVDPKIFSFIYNGEARFLLAKTVTPVSGHDGEDTTFSMIAAPTPPYGCWSVLAKDITLQYPSRNGAPVATNPHGIAQTRGLLRIIDAASTDIYTIGTDDLNGLTDYSRFTLAEAPFDVGAAAGLDPAKAKGQAIISIKDGNGQCYLFALYIVSVVNSKADIEYQKSILVRLKVDGNGTITYDGKTLVGPNAVEIIPITTKDATTNVETTYLLIPAIGGGQKAGTTNGEDSNVCRVAAFGEEWPELAPVAFKGVPVTTTLLGDFRAIAASDRAKGAGKVYILIGYFSSNLYNGFNWNLYQSTVDKVIAADELDIIAATSGTNPVLKRVDFDNAIAPTASNPYGIYFYDILYETSLDAEDDSKDRLLFFKGSALQISTAAEYPGSTPETLEPPSDDPAPLTGAGYVLFPLGVRDGRIGGYNIDSADLTAETLRQYKRGVSLKRGARAAHITPGNAGV